MTARKRKEHRQGKEKKKKKVISGSYVLLLARRLVLPLIDPFIHRFARLISVLKVFFNTTSCPLQPPLPPPSFLPPLLPSYRSHLLSPSIPSLLLPLLPSHPRN